MKKNTWIAANAEETEAVFETDGGEITAYILDNQDGTFEISVSSEYADNTKVFSGSLEQAKERAEDMAWEFGYETSYDPAEDLREQEREYFRMVGAR